MKYIESQFSNPLGIIVHLVGMIMAYENRNLWALSLLDIQPADRILEIGIGPGGAVQQASGMAVNGLVAAVDRSITKNEVIRSVSNCCEWDSNQRRSLSTPFTGERHWE